MGRYFSPPPSGAGYLTARVEKACFKTFINVVKL